MFSALKTDLAVPFKRLEDWALSGPLTAALGALLLAMLACWVPHYLTWPWWIDLDHFATLALSWDRGQRLPYRDLPSIQFPGEFYVFWALGKVFGWGRTVPLYACDAAALLLFGGAIAATSRRRCGRMLPGLVGVLAFSWYYLNLGFDQVAQRDWHAPLLFVLALLMAGAGPSRTGRAASAAAAAMALAIRPHTILFLPAMAIALDEGARAPGESWTRTLRATLEWGVTLAAGLTLAFAPLYFGGLWESFLDGLRHVAPGRGYSQLTPLRFRDRLLTQLGDQPWLWTTPLASVCLAAVFVPRHRRFVLVWVLALAGAYFYKPLSPVPHHYLSHAVNLFWSVDLFVVAMLLLEVRGRIAPLRLIAIGLLVYWGCPSWPRFADPIRSLKAIPWLVKGEMPVDPPASGTWNDVGWKEYRALIAHLKRTTAAETPVANVLGSLPAINGVVGRPTPMPAECLSWFIYWNTPEMRAEYARSLAEAPPTTVVVWIPSERGGLLTEAVAVAIEQGYAFEAKFGNVQVWRKTPDLPRAETP